MQPRVEYKCTKADVQRGTQGIAMSEMRDAHITGATHTSVVERNCGFVSGGKGGFHAGASTGHPFKPSCKQ